MKVIIEGLDQDARDAGFSEQSLKSAVELRLRQSGIRVLDEGPVSVYVRLNVLDDKAGAYTFSIEVELLEFVYTERHIASILRDVEITTLNDFLSELGAGHQATTWGKESWTGYANHSDARTYIRDNVLEYVDRFANDYLAANPR